MQLNSGSLQMLRRGLATANLTADDVIVVNVPPERHLSAVRLPERLTRSSPTIRCASLANRGAVDIYNSSAIAGDVVNLLVVSRGYLESHPAQCRALVDAWWSGPRRVQRARADAGAWSARSASG